MRYGFYAETKDGIQFIDSESKENILDKAEEMLDDGEIESYTSFNGKEISNFMLEILKELGISGYIFFTEHNEETGDKHEEEMFNELKDRLDKKIVYDESTDFFKEENSLKKVKNKYRELSKEFHPDMPFGSEEIFKIINNQYQQASLKYKKSKSRAM